MIASVFLATLLSAASVSAHGVIIGVQGEKGSPKGVGFQVSNSIARNCTGISPCQQDTTIIRDQEIATNVVNECGRTEIGGNIDVGTETENQLAAGQVTQVKKGTVMQVTIHQVNADGAGPYVCDLDQTSNSGVLSRNLTVTNNVPGSNGLSQASTEDFTMSVAMPDDVNCVGGSTGNICTVRCRNNAQAGPFGGCFAVQQTDNTPNANSANTLKTAQSLDAINKQIAQNIQDLPAADAANANKGAASAVTAGAAVKEFLGQASFTSKAAAVETPTLANVNKDAPVAQVTGTAQAAAPAATTAAANNGGKKGKGSGAAANGAKAGANGQGAKGAKGANKRSLLRWAKRDE